MSLMAVVAWMWMAAQQPLCTGVVMADLGHGTASVGMPDGCIWPETQGWCCDEGGGNVTVPANWPKPQEHVIEIKTRRGHPDQVVDNWRECDPMADDVVMINRGGNGMFPVACRSRDEIRELWIDGVKWGVLRESEGK